MKKLTTLFFTCLCFINNLKAQDIETILLAKDDAEKLTNAYLQPAFKGLIYSMNNGWYHTAKVHKKFGFDITIGASIAQIPSKEEMFNLTNLNLSSNTNGFTETPTIGGSSEDGAELTYTLSEDDLPDGIPTNINYSTTFTLPGGVKDELPMNAVPAPSVQVGLGLPYKFEIIGRFVPEIGSDDVTGKLLGIGLKKEITSIFGPMEKTPLHVSLLAAYTRMTVNYEIGTGSESNINYTDAYAEFLLKSYTVQAIASLNLPIINFYGGVGFNGGNSQLDMLGVYNLSYDVNSTITSLPNVVSEEVTDPLSLKTTVSSFNATIGTRLSLGFFKIFASYTLQEYNSINAGIALSFR